MARKRELPIPAPGDVFEIRDDTESVEYQVLRRRGIAYLVEVTQLDPPLGDRQRPGLMAVDRQGRAWTIYEPETIEPWEG